MIKVLQWNCQGLRKRAAELRIRLLDKPDERPDVMLLQETNTSSINFSGYTAYSSPSITSKRPGYSASPPGKAIVYARSDWYQHQVDLTPYCDEQQEVVGVRATVQQTNHIFVSIYYRPLRDKTRTRNHGWIAHLHDVYPREQKHYGGDFNLQHQTWGYAQSSNGAEDLIGEMQTFRLQLANKKGTKTRLGGAGQKDTTPDLSWTTNQYIQHQKWKCLIDPWGSDHFPILFEFSPTKKVKNMTKKRVAKTVYWDRFRDVLREDK